jgi:hypothetical protein
MKLSPRTPQRRKLNTKGAAKNARSMPKLELLLRRVLNAEADADADAKYSLKLMVLLMLHATTSLKLVHAA